MRASQKSRRLIQPKATRLDGNVPIENMPCGPIGAATAAVSTLMLWSPSMKATVFLEDLVLVSVLLIIVASA